MNVSIKWSLFVAFCLFMAVPAQADFVGNPFIVASNANIRFQQRPSSSSGMLTEGVRNTLVVGGSASQCEYNRFSTIAYNGSASYGSLLVNGTSANGYRYYASLDAGVIPGSAFFDVQSGLGLFVTVEGNNLRACSTLGNNAASEYPFTVEAGSDYSPVLCPDLGYLGGGQYWAAWTRGKMFSVGALRGRRITGPNTFGPTVDLDISRKCFYPHVVSAGGRRALVFYQYVWEEGSDPNPDNWDWDIRCLIVSNDSVIGSASVAAGVGLPETQVAAAFSPFDNTVLAVWDRLESGVHKIYGSIGKVGDSSIAWGPDFLVFPYATQPAVSWDYINNKFGVSWSFETSTSPQNRDIYFKLLNTDGSTYRAPVAVQSSSVDESMPTLAVTHNGTTSRWAITWIKADSDATHTCWGRLYEAPRIARTLRIEGPDVVAPNSSALFRAILDFGDGTSYDVTQLAYWDSNYFLTIVTGKVTIGSENPGKAIMVSAAGVAGISGSERPWRGFFVDTPPPAPGLVSPAPDAVGQSLTPTLQASAFVDVDSGDYHTGSHWQVDDSADFSSPVWEANEPQSASTTYTVPVGYLSPNASYYWRCRYRDRYGAWSAWATARRFTTQANVTPTLYVTPVVRDVGSSEGTITFEVSNPGGGTISYAASESVSWFTVQSGGSGGNNGTITVAYEANGGSSPRSGTLSVTASGASGSPKTLTINQSGNTTPSLAVTPANRNVGATAGIVTFVVANTGGGAMSYSTSEDTSWLVVQSGGGGGNNGTISIAFEANGSTTPRSAVLTITSAGAVGSPTLVTVNQAGNTTPELAVNPASQDVGADAGSTTFTVSNTGGGSLAYTTSEDSSWFDVQSGGSGGNNGTIKVIYGVNASATSRSGTLTVTAGGAGGSPTIVTINQAGNPTPNLSVMPASRSVDAKAGTAAFVVSNTGGGSMSYSTTEDVAWFGVVSGGSGGNSGTINVSYEANGSSSPRSGTLTLTAVGATGSPLTLSISQAGNNLGEALEQTGWTWSSGGAANWSFNTRSWWTHDGTDSARNDTVRDNGDSYLQTTIQGPGVLRFWWKNQMTYQSECHFQLDGAAIYSRVGANFDWRDMMIKIPSGAHQLKWLFRQVDVGSGTDMGVGVDEVEFLPEVPLPQALDATQLIWRTGGYFGNPNTWETGDLPMGGWFGQSWIASKGGSAARSGTLKDEFLAQESWLETTVRGPGTLSFSWKISASSSETLKLYIDGVEQAGALTGATDWQARVVELGPGSKTLRWKYVKGRASSDQSDAAWLDDVHWLPRRVHAHPCDFDGDDKSDIAVYYVPLPTIGYAPSPNWEWNLSQTVRGGKSKYHYNQAWYVMGSSNGVGLGQSGRNFLVGSSQYGIPAPMDVDGDGSLDVASYHQYHPDYMLLGWEDYKDSQGWWVSQYAGWNRWGWSETVPVPEDYDGDGKSDRAVYHPASGMWYILESLSGRSRSQSWGWSAAVPVLGDYDGDIKADLAVYHPPSGMWYILFSSGKPSRIQNWGFAGTIPVPGDYDGDGKTDLAVFYPPNGNWYIWPSGGGSARIQNWGWRDTIPVPGDYDGDNKADLAVFYPAGGTWYILNSRDNRMRQQPWGWKETRPIATQYQINRWFRLTF